MEHIYKFWKDNSNLWFSSTIDDDKYITKLFLDDFNKYFDINIESLNVQDWTSYVILYDQIIRHINRNTNKVYTPPKYFIENCYNKFSQFDILTDFEFMFMLMPIRHTHELYHIHFVLNHTWNRLEKTNSIAIKKYLIATYERYIKCSPNMDHSNVILFNDNKYTKLDFIDIIDKKFTEYITQYDSSILIKQMEDFIHDNKLDNKLITVSISGGVDSMVCSYLLKLINHPFIMIHIDYYNRDECEKEESLLKWWCSNVLNTPLYIRRIDEINRPRCMKYELRELYESYTKNIRFYSYITINLDYNTEPYVMLGHNKDDTIENIFTNIASCSHYDNLLGMTPISKQTINGHTINFIRPLLTIMKKDIYDFALFNDVPFLVDSTPKWSQRGKIRDIVRPALEEWNPLILDGFINMSQRLNDMTKLVETLISKEINYTNINDIPVDSIYWDIVFKKNNINITMKTMKCFIDKIKFLKKYPHKLSEIQYFTLCKNHFIEFKQKDKLYITIK